MHVYEEHRDVNTMELIKQFTRMVITGYANYVPVLQDVEAQFESDNNNISINNTANRGQVSPTVSDSCVKQGGTCTGYDINEVAAHNMYSSCWIVISDLVYDVTDFLEEVSVLNVKRVCIQLDLKKIYLLPFWQL